VNCDTVRELIQPLVDQELDLTQKPDIEAHLRSCVGCAEFLHELTELRQSIRDKAPYYPAPEQLAGRVRTAVRASARAERRANWRWTWLGAAASLGFAAAVLWGVVVLRSGGSQQDLLAQQIVSSHVRSLMASHLVDVPSTDQHTVKPWFNGKLDFSPQVKDLTDEGFRLTGGRLDYLNQRAVAALIYQRRQHIINLFVWPMSPNVAGGPAAFARNGFNVVHWTDGGLEYWAVSDLNAAELNDFARLYEK
jgi:anti-sigma factor RsiW